MSELGSGPACPRAVIAYCPSLLQCSAVSVHHFALFFVPPFYPGWSYWRYGLYWVMLACGSGVTPSLCLLALAV